MDAFHSIQRLTAEQHGYRLLARSLDHFRIWVAMPPPKQWAYANENQTQSIAIGQAHFCVHRNPRRGVNCSRGHYRYIIPSDDPLNPHVRRTETGMCRAVVLCPKINFWSLRAEIPLPRETFADGFPKNNLLDSYNLWCGNRSNTWTLVEENDKILIAKGFQLYFDDAEGNANGIHIWSNRTDNRFIIAKNNPLWRYLHNPKTKTCRFVAVMPKRVMWRGE